MALTNDQEVTTATGQEASGEQVTSSTETDQANQAPQSQPQEAATQDQAATGQTAEQKAQAEAEAAAKAQAQEESWAKFQSVLADAVAARDTSTGTLPEAAIENVKAAYRALDGIKYKNQAKESVADGMKRGITERDLSLAKAFADLQEQALVAVGPKQRTPAPPADPTEAFVEQYASLMLAGSYLGTHVAEGVNDDWPQRTKELVDNVTEDLNKLAAWQDNEAEDKGDAPKVHPVVEQALRLARGRRPRAVRKADGTTARRSPNRSGADLGKHIAEAFADKDNGAVLTIGEILKYQSSEYPQGAVSSGAISARVFPTNGGACTVTGDGYKIEGAEKDGKKAARRVDVAG